MKKKGISTGMAIVVVIVVVAIIGGSAAIMMRGGETEVTVTSLWSEDEENAFLNVVEEVEADTGIQVEHDPRTTDALQSQTLIDYESERATADIAVMPWPSRIQRDAEEGHLEPVGDLWDPNDFNVSPDPVTVNGKVYAVPFKVDVKPGFWYRKSFFEKHDLSEPDNYEEFMTLLEEISKIEGVDAPIASGNGDGWPLSDVTEAFIMRQNNGAQLQKDLINGDADFTDPRVKTAFEEIRELQQENYFSTQRDFGTQYTYFWENQTPLYFMGSWMPAQDQFNPEDLGVFRLPGANGVVGSVNWLTIPKYSEDVDNAKKVAEELATAEKQAIWAEEGGFIATNLNVPEDSYEYAVTKQMANLASEAKVVGDLDDGLGDPFQTEFWSQLKSFWSDPSRDIDDILNTLEQEQNSSLEE